MNVESDHNNYFGQKSALQILIILAAVFYFFSLFLQRNEQNDSGLQPNNTAGCISVSPSIGYSLLKEGSRRSDVNSIFIKECYILLEKQLPALDELIQLATILGRNNENIEFKIFDDQQAYALYEKYITSHREEDASEKEWKFLYDHYLAWYLKANTQLRTNYLQPVGNAYFIKGQTSIPAISISN